MGIKEVFVPAMNDARAVSLCRNGDKIVIRGYFELSVVDFFTTEKIVKRRVPVKVLKKALLEDNKMDVNGKSWLQHRDKKSGLDLFIHSWRGYEEENYHEAFVYFEPSFGGLNLIVVRPEDLKGGLKQVIGDEE